MADGVDVPDFERHSFIYLTQQNPLRRNIIQIVRCRWFERLVILIILCNCVMLSLYDPLDRECETNSCQHLDIMEMFVFSFFALEMFMKMIAMGVFGSKSYFSDHWNILDLCIVIAGIFDRVGLRGDFLTIARLGRVLRPLRAINRVPSIRILVTLLIDTIPMLGNVMLLAFLVFSLFGIVGLQVWQGKLRNRCFMTEYTMNIMQNRSLNVTHFYQPADGSDYLCSSPEDFGINSCDKIPRLLKNKTECSLSPFSNQSSIYINGSMDCINWNSLYTTCLPSEFNPLYNSVSFDNVGMALVFIYQVVTLEGWSELMYLVQDVSSYWTWIYFVALITIGSFFLVNLSLVVITMQFSETKKRELKLIREQRLRRASRSNLSLISDVRWLRDMVISRFRCCRQAHIHHFHHHEHHHFHHFSYQCEKCKMFCGFQLGSISPPLTSMQQQEKSGVEVALPLSDGECQEHVKEDITVRINHHDDKEAGKKISSESTKSIGNNTILGLDKSTSSVNNHSDGHSVFLLARKNCKQSADGGLKPHSPNTLSIHAESVASVQINPSNPYPATATSQTAISVHVNGSPLINKTTINTTEVKIDCRGAVSKATSKAETTVTASITPEPSRRDKPKTSGIVNANTDNAQITAAKIDVVSDYGDTGSDMLYGSMFDIKNADMYFVSDEPTYTERFRMYSRRISESQRFSYFIMVIIVLNTVCMGMEHHNQPIEMTESLESLNLVFIWIFTLEMFIKMLGIGFRGYFRNGFNVFDCSIVFLSIIELLIEKGSGGSSFIVLRSVRLLRIFKLVRPMRHQMLVMVKTMSSVVTFFALLFLFMFTFAILGMNIFGGKFDDSSPSRSNFDTFLWAMVTVFQVLTQEDWNLVMYSGMRATGKPASLYFVTLMTIGYYVLLNLLVAILVEGFTTPMEKRRMARRLAEMLMEKQKKTEVPLRRVRSLPDIKEILFENEGGADNGLKGGAMTDCRKRRRITVANFAPSIPAEIQKAEPVKEAEAASQRKKAKKNMPVLIAARKARRTNGSPERRHLNMGQTELGEFSTVYDVFAADQSKVVRFFIRRRSWSLYCLSPDNRIRCYLSDLIKHRWFDYGILLLILFSCVLLAMETPNQPMDPQRKQFMDIATFITTWIFTAEMLFKILAFGLLIGRGAYLKNGWNILDGLLVVLSWVDVAVTLADSNSRTDIFKALRVLRALRTLRPLRMIQRAPGLKVVVQTLLYSLKPIGNTVLIAGIFFVVFGILGVQMLKGKFRFCSDAEYPIETRDECLGFKGAKWTNYQYNFDNLPQALVSLFVISTKDGWVDIMHHGIDARGVDLEPKKNFAAWRIVYFISFLLIGGFLVLNMIVGIVVENFQRCRELQGNQDRAKQVFERWKECVEERKMKALKQRYMDNNSRFRLLAYQICTHTYWVVGVTCLILVNTVCMAIEHYEMSKEFTDFAEIGNIIFTCLYTLEAIMQLTAFGCKRFFKTKWYVFDIIVVILSIIGITMRYVQAQKLWFNPALIRAMRMLRVVRVLKLLKIAKGLRFLLDHVAETIPQVTNLGLLFLLLFFIYSCLGMQLFGSIVCDEQSPCAGLGRHANFKDMGHSMLTLFRVATGDNWSGILKDTLRTDCDNSLDCVRNCCISRYTAPLFFVTFVLFAQFVLVNIVIAVLMKHLRVNNLCVGGKESPAFKQNLQATKEQLAVTRSHAGLKKWHARAKEKIVKDEDSCKDNNNERLLFTNPEEHCKDTECSDKTMLLSKKRSVSLCNLSVKANDDQSKMRKKCHSSLLDVNGHLTVDLDLLADNPELDYVELINAAIVEDIGLNKAASNDDMASISNDSASFDDDPNLIQLNTNDFRTSCPLFDDTSQEAINFDWSMCSRSSSHRSSFVSGTEVPSRKSTLRRNSSHTDCNMLEESPRRTPDLELARFKGSEDNGSDCQKPIEYLDNNIEEMILELDCGFKITQV